MPDTLAIVGNVGQSMLEAVENSVTGDDRENPIVRSIPGEFAPGDELVVTSPDFGLYVST